MTDGLLNEIGLCWITPALCGVHRNTAAFYFLRLREIIALEIEAESEALFGGEVEIDESYFGGKRKGKRGRGSAGKTPVFSLLARGGKYTRRLSRMLRQPR